MTGVKIERELLKQIQESRKDFKNRRFKKLSDLLKEIK